MPTLAPRQQINTEPAMNQRVATTIVAIALPLALSLPALAQQGSATPQQAPPAASQGNAAITMTKDEVRQLQQALNDNGFDAGEVDGVFGAQTSEALKRFQSKAGLPPTGKMDQQTLALVGLSGRATQSPAGASPTTGQGGAGGQPANPAPAEQPR
jgi:peptidoglycan hydrolase-like protein with peptidoglycan-binding domain